MFEEKVVVVTGGAKGIGKAIADKLGMDFEISDMEFDAIIPAIQNGKASIGMAGMTVTPDREKNVSFSQTYATGVQVIIVPEGKFFFAVRALPALPFRRRAALGAEVVLEAVVDERGELPRGHAAPRVGCLDRDDLVLAEAVQDLP